MKKSMFLLLLVSVCTFLNAQLPKPTPEQIAWQKMETTAFLHFGVNTFTDREWGDGTEDPSLFNPINFDAEKIVLPLKEAGFKMVIITAKHHDGFCLWPSKFTEHSVKNSPWKNGKGDVVKELSEACKKYGIRFGFYLSPWDMHEKSYGTEAYNQYFRNQLQELLTNYGVISEVWFDGAKGKNARDMEYDFRTYWAMVRELQPSAVLFSDVGPDVRWVGNEAGNAGETCWSSIDTTGMAPGKADEHYLNTGDPQGKLWIPPETDVSIRPGWFYHSREDKMVKTGKNLVDLYYKSVGRNSLLLLNIPPNKEGLFSAQDVKSIKEFRNTLDETFRTNLAQDVVHPRLTDKNLNTFITLKAGMPIVFEFKNDLSFDRALFQENITNGQMAEAVLMEYWENNTWKKLEAFTTIGYKRLLRFSRITTPRIRLTIAKTKSDVQLAEFGLFIASVRE